MYLVVCLLLVFVGILIGIGYPYKGSLSDAASYAGILSGVITFFSFIVALLLYLKWRLPLIASERRSVLEDISSLSEQHKNCGLFLTEYINESSVPMNEMIKTRALIELHHITVKISILDAFIKSSIELSSNEDINKHIFELDDLIGAMCNMTEGDKLSTVEQRQKFLELNQACMQLYVDFTWVVRGEGR